MARSLVHSPWSPLVDLCRAVAIPSQEERSSFMPPARQHPFSSSSSLTVRFTFRLHKSRLPGITSITQETA